MAKPRIIETNEGIQGEVTVEIYDQFAKTMRDRGWHEIDNLLKIGMTKGHALEIGPGPGYVGLEWLKKTDDTMVTGCEISPDMLKLAQKNAAEYGFETRTAYVKGTGMTMPFEAETFDNVFSNGSLHEWEDPIAVFNEIARVLKPGGKFCISDMRRDVNPLLKWGIYAITKPKAIRPGYLTSLNAAYTTDELESLLSKSTLKHFSVQKAFFGLTVTGWQ
ncbi:class I SAM-dependent methyltransferase [Fusibacter paucivorans]|uniref:Class I SAM-dependent methyltransferase n=1 Tax=Fusibacter paucivorans TaxID=76009 RepID=A0ABS5PRX9_9FIRM|nr:class I SAM-dependent methyltransferase [Fusibacter paucivorans]MBS7527652.1 class I SAM-dependent methyltransferase [Fusibacter paucivorans]